MVGFSLGLIALVVHLATLRSFGEPYLSPLAPFRPRELKDALYLAPRWGSDQRPALSPNDYRQAPNLKPGPEQGGER